MSNSVSASPSFMVGERESSVSVWGLPGWYVSAFKWLVISVFGLIVLGGSVRIMNAGLACPDWPLCFGDVIPDFHPQVYFEFIHRVVAGVLGLTTVSLIYILGFRSSAPRALKVWGLVAVLILLTQVVVGGLTVTLQLHSKVVTLHLMLGSGFFLTLLWIYLGLRDEGTSGVSVGVPAWARRLCVFIGLVVYGQFFLGGMVASHFAALVCTDFPTCHGQWFPTFSGPVGLHVIHRLGAYFVFVATLASWMFLRRSGSARLAGLAQILFSLVCVQICVGISNVLFHTPPIIAATHLAIGAGLLSVALRQLHIVMRPPVRS